MKPLAYWWTCVDCNMQGKLKDRTGDERKVLERALKAHERRGQCANPDGPSIRLDAALPNDCLRWHREGKSWFSQLTFNVHMRYRYQIFKAVKMDRNAPYRVLATGSAQQPKLDARVRTIADGKQLAELHVRQQFGPKPKIC